MRTPFILSVLLAVLGLATSVMSGDRKPNILFLFADDFAYNAVRARGATDVDTPHLDKLASRGTTFTHAYTMGSWSGAVCVASRTMLITGRSVWSANSIYQTTDAESRSMILLNILSKPVAMRIDSASLRKTG